MYLILIIKEIIKYLPFLILLIFTMLSGSCDIATHNAKENDPVPLCDENSKFESEIHTLHEESLLMITAGRYKEAENQLKGIITSQPEFYGAYRTMGEIVSRYSGNMETIAEFFNELLKQNPGNGYAYWGFGLLGIEQREYDSALEYFRKAIACRPEFYDIFENLVDIYSIQGKIQEAAPSLKLYFQDLQTEGFDDAEYGLAYLYYNLGKMDDALKICEKLCSKTILQYPGRLYKLTGTLYSKKRHNQNAYTYFQCAYKAFRACGDKQGETAALINLGIANDLLLNYEKALEKYQQALLLAKLLRYDIYEGLILMNTGLMYTNLDDYSKSFIYYQQALTHFIKMAEPNKEKLIDIYTNLGQLHEYVSDYSRALDYYTTTLHLSREIKRSDLEVRALNNLGEVYKRKMDLDKALDSYSQAMELERDKNNFWKKAVILNNIGEIYSKTGKYSKAIDVFKQSLGNRQQTGDRRGEGITNKNIGYLFYLKGDYTQALDYYRKALKLVVKESVESAEITGEMGICYTASKQYDKAYTYLKKSIEMIEMVRNRLKYEKHKTGFMRHKRRIYDTIVELLYTVQQGIPDKKYGYSAFEFSEKAKARTLLNMLEENKIQIKKGIAPERATRIKEIDREYNSISTRLQEELNKPGKEENRKLLKSLSGDLKRLENEYEDELIQATIENPHYEHISYTRQISPAQIQQDLLDDSTLLLSYQVTENALFTWRISKDSYLFLRQSLEQKKLEEKVLYLYHLISKPGKDDDYLEAASELYTLLIKPVLSPGSPYNKLIIIPDRILHYLPFQVLVSEEQESPAYLVRKYSIQYVQSASILYYLCSQKKTTYNSGETGEEALLAIGNPVFNKGITQTAAARLSAESLFSLHELKPLPFSGMEVREIGKLFPHTLILSGMDALEKRIKQQGALNGYSYIHFATHSIINEESSQGSGLILTQDNDPGEDGFLQVREIFNLETRAHLVVLSACNTKLGEYIDGEGIIGLTRAWMYAGASAVIASLWSIHDESTFVFMADFYRNSKAGLSHASALRQTQLKMMEQDTYRHPYFWAGFMLTGID